MTAQSRLTWSIDRLTDGRDYLIETMGGGGGFVDYDRDGWLDIYMVAYSRRPRPGGGLPRDALYRNNGDGTFTDVSALLPPAADGVYGMGLTVGDYDNDGWPDLYLSGYRGSRLLHNRQGRFEDVTATAHVGATPWATGAAFFDYDNDGRLDLFVANYLEFDEGQTSRCNVLGGRYYCAPSMFRGEPAMLFHNDGASFTDVSAEANVSRRGRGLGVVAWDYDGDGRMDVFQANDGEANFLFHNEGKGRFSEVALEAGVAYDPNGAPRGGMGVDAEDAFGTGRPDLFVANFSLETNAYFANAGEGSFRETTPTLGLGSISYLMSGFGAAFLDYDNDGRPDLFVLNGHPLDTVAQAYPTVSYAEPPFLFENNGRGFEEVAARRGEPLARAYAGRGLAVADYDNDGDPDLLLLNVGQSPVLCRNDGGSASHWLGVTLQGTRSNRDGIGARVTVVAGGRSQTRRALGGRSYLSACDRRLLFGLGGADRVDRLEVQWPSGARSELLGLRADRYVPVRE